MDKDFLSDEEMAKLEGQSSDFISDEDMAKLEAKPAEPGFGQQALDAVMKGLQYVDSVTGAPVRAGIMAAVDQDPETTILGQAASRFGRDPAETATGKDIAAKLGLSRVQDVPVFPTALVPEAAEEFLGVKPGDKYVKASPAGIAGLGIEMATDPLTYFTGGAAKAVAKPIEKAGAAVSSAAKSAVKGGASDLVNIAKGAKAEGAAAMKAAKTLEGTGVGGVEKLYAGIKGGIQGAKGTAEAAKEIADVGQQAKRVLIRRLDEMPGLDQITAIGNGKRIREMSDDDAILEALLSDFDNPIKNWMAEKAATELPGQITKDEYLKVLNMPMAERIAAKEFNAFETAQALAPELEKTKDLFKGATSKRWNELQGVAMQKYDPAQTKSVMDELTLAYDEATRVKGIPSSVKTELEAIDDIIMNGVGTRKFGLKEAPLNAVDAPEQFKRLQAARQILDSKINWAKREGITQTEQMLRGVRDKVDDALKFSPEKVEVDSMYRTAKGIEKKFFGALEFMNKDGSIDIDAPKLARMLGDTDQAKRFKSAVEEFKTFIEQPGLDDEFVANAQEAITGLEKQIAVMDQKRILSRFRQAQGPTSPAVERMQAATGGGSPLPGFVQSPAGTGNQAEQIFKTVSEKLGRPVAEFTDADRSAVARWYTWKMKNPKATMQQSDDQFKALFPEVRRRDAIDDFTK